MALLVRQVSATSIIVIRTPDEVSAASDSMGTFQRGPAPVCKISTAGGVFLAIAGIDNDPVTHFSVARIVFDALRTKATFDDRTEAAVRALRSALYTEALSLKRDGNRINDFTHLINPAVDSLTITLFGLENGVPVAFARSLLVRDDLSGTVTVTDGTVKHCPGADCPNGTYIFKLGSHRAVDAFLDSHIGFQIGRTPAEGARILVQQEIDAQTEGVGPPIDVVRIRAIGNDLDTKTGCPIEIKAPSKSTNEKKR